MTFDELPDAPPQAVSGWDSLPDSQVEPAERSIYGKLEDLTGLPADISSGFVSGATWNYLDAEPTPEGAGPVRRIGATVANLTGMGIGLLPVTWVSKPVLGALAVGKGVAATRALTVAGGALTGAIYGAGKKPGKGQTRTENAITDAAFFAAGGAIGAGVEAGASKLSTPIRKMLEKKLTGAPMKPEEKGMEKAMEYVSSSITGGSFAGGEELKAQIEAGEIDPLKIGEKIIEGGVGFGLAHAVQSKIPGMRRKAADEYKELPIPINEPELKESLDVKETAKADSIFIPPSPKDAESQAQAEAAKLQESNTLQKGEDLAKATAKVEALHKKRRDASAAGAPKEVLKPIEEQVKLAEKQHEDVIAQLEEVSTESPIGRTASPEAIELLSSIKSREHTVTEPNKYGTYVTAEVYSDGDWGQRVYQNKKLPGQIFTDERDVIKALMAKRSGGVETTGSLPAGPDSPLRPAGQPSAQGEARQQTQMARMENALNTAVRAGEKKTSFQVFDEALQNLPTEQGFELATMLTEGTGYDHQSAVYIIHNAARGVFPDNAHLEQWNVIYRAIELKESTQPQSQRSSISWLERGSVYRSTVPFDEWGQLIDQYGNKGRSQTKQENQARSVEKDRYVNDVTSQRIAVMEAELGKGLPLNRETQQMIQEDVIEEYQRMKRQGTEVFADQGRPSVMYPREGVHTDFPPQIHRTEIEREIIPQGEPGALFDQGTIAKRGMVPDQPYLPSGYTGMTAEQRNQYMILNEIKTPAEREEFLANPEKFLRKTGSIVTENGVTKVPMNEWEARSSDAAIVKKEKAEAARTARSFRENEVTQGPESPWQRMLRERKIELFNKNVALETGVVLPTGEREFGIMLPTSKVNRKLNDAEQAKRMDEIRRKSEYVAEQEFRKSLTELTKKMIAQKKAAETVQKLDADGEKQVGMTVRKMDTLDAETQTWLNQHTIVGGGQNFPEGKTVAFAEAERFLGLKLIDAGNATDIELSASIQYLAGNRGILPEGTTVIIGHGEGGGKDWRFVGHQESIAELVSRTLPHGEKAYVIACDELQKRDFSVAEGEWIKSIRAEVGKVSDQPDEISPLTIEPAEPERGTVFGTMVFGALHIGDWFPETRPIMEAFVNGSLRKSHNINAVADQGRLIIWEAEKLLGGRDINKSIVERLFAKDQTWNSQVRKDWNAWVKGEKPIPKGLEPLLEKWRAIHRKAQSKIFDAAEKKIWANHRVARQKPDPSNPAKTVDDIDPKTGRPTFIDNAKMRVLVNSIKEGKIDLSGNSNDWVKKNQAALFEVHKKAFETTRENFTGVDKIDLHEAKNIISDLEAAKKWGQNPDNYVTENFSGQYKIIGENGGVVGSGFTAKAAISNTYRNLSKNTGISRAQKFTMTSTLHQFMEAKGSYEPMRDRGELVYGEDGAVAAIAQAFNKGNRPDTFKDMSAAARVYEENMKAAIDQGKDLFTINIQPTDFRQSGKWFGSMLKKSTSLEGGVADPLTNMIKYVTGLETKLVVDDVSRDVLSGLRQVKGINLRNLIEGKLRAFRGEYSTLDRELDDYRSKLALFVDKKLGSKYGDKLRGEGALGTRASAALQMFTANATMGYAPVKAAVNYYGGTMHTIIKTGFVDYAAGQRHLKNPKFAEFVDSHGWEYGQNSGLANEMGANKAEKWKPLYLFQKAEHANRRNAFAAAYVKAMRESTIGDPNLRAIEATGLAIESARLTQGVYVAAARPGLINGSSLSGPVLNTSFQFKQYMVNEARYMNSLTPAQWAKYVPYMLAAGGTRGAITATKSVLVLAGLGALLDELNERMNIAMPGLHRGIPGILGLDLSAAATWQLPGTTKEMLGKPISDLVSSVEILRKKMGVGLTDKEWSDYYRQILPTAYSIHKGIQTLSGGNITKGTRTQQFIPNDTRVKEGVINLLGARSTRESEESDNLQFIKTATRKDQAKFEVLLDRVVGSKNGVQAAAIIKQAQDEGYLPASAAAAIKRAYETRSLPLLLRTYRAAGPGVKTRLNNMGFQLKIGGQGDREN